MLSIKWGGNVPTSWYGVNSGGAMGASHCAGPGTKNKLSPNPPFYLSTSSPSTKNIPQNISFYPISPSDPHPNSPHFLPPYKKFYPYLHAPTFSPKSPFTLRGLRGPRSWGLHHVQTPPPLPPESPMGRLWGIPLRLPSPADLPSMRKKSTMKRGIRRCIMIPSGHF